MDAFTSAYVEAALWTSTGDSDEYLDRNYGISDIAPATLEVMVADCKRFQADNEHLINDDNCRYKRCPPQEYAGHDFWLTRNHHGCGFWDGDWSEEAGQALTDAASKYREVSLYVGDDGLVHAM
jgi:hypothetical protein